MSCFRQRTGSRWRSAFSGLALPLPIWTHSEGRTTRRCEYYIRCYVATRCTPPKQVGRIDRVFRIALGPALIGASLLGYIGRWGWIGLLQLATGVFRFCPSYWPFGLSTCPVRSASPRA